MKPKPWSRREESRLRAIYPKMPTAEIAQLLGRTAKGVASRAKVLGIRKASGCGGKVVWTKQRDAILRKLYPDQFAPAVAKALRMPVYSVYNRAFRLGLEKSAKFRAMQRRVEGERLKVFGIAHRFHKGQVPPNKGLRRPGYSIGRGRMRETQFKKGQCNGRAAQLKMPLWSFRWVGGYLMLKTGKQHAPPNTRWEYVHRLIWEQANGPLPHWRESRVWWKDGDHANCLLSNLELVAGRDHVLRTTIHRYPAPLKELIRLHGKLERKLRKKEEANAQEHDRGPAQSPVRGTRSAAGQREAHGD